MKKTIISIYSFLFIVTFTLTVFAQGPMQVTITADQNNICRGDTVTLTVSIIGGTGPFTYSWLNPTGSDSSVVIVTPAYSTIYGLWVADTLGNDTTRNILVTVLQRPRPDFTMNSVCVGTPVSITDNSTMPSQSCSADLIISEYVEGTSNNKAIEIYNGTNRIINLDKYTLEKFSNGSDTSTELDDFLPDLLIQNASYVVCHPSSNDSLKSKSNDTTDGSIITYGFSGNDALALKNPSGLIIDIFGMMGDTNMKNSNEWKQDTVKTKDQTLVRRPSILNGVINNPDNFDPSVEWVQFAQDDFSQLKSHTMNCPSPVIASYKWDYGDSDSSTTSGSHQHTYGTSGKYPVKLTLTSDNGCTADTTIETEIGQEVEISINNNMKDTGFCAGNSITLNSPVSNGNQWFKDGDTLVFEFFQTYQAKTTGSYQLKVNNGCTDTITAPLSIVVYDNPKPVIFGDFQLCKTDSAIFIAKNISPPALIVYEWHLNGITIENETDSSIIYKAPGNDGDILDVWITDTNNCKNSTDSTIFVFENPDVSIKSTMGDTLCPNTPISLDGTTQNVSLYTWIMDGDTVRSGLFAKFDTITSTFKNTTEYKLIGTSAEGCSNFAIVNILTIDSVKAGASESYCVNERPWLLTGGLPLNGFWTSANIIVDSSGIITGIGDPGNYKVKYTFGNCSAEKTIQINNTKAPTDKNICINEGQFLLGNATPGGGTWSGPGLTNASTGNVNPAGLSGSAFYVYSSDGCSDTMEVTFTNKSTAPVVTCDSSTIRTVYFSWNPIPGISNYIVSESGNPFINKGNINFYSVSGLFENQSITLQVFAQNTDCGSDTSVLVSCVTKSCIPFSISMSRNDSTLCQGEQSTVLTTVTGGKGPFFINYVTASKTQNPGEAMAPPDTQKSYPSGYRVKVSVTDSGQLGCQSISSKIADSILIYVYPNPKVRLLADTLGVSQTGLVRFYNPDTAGISSYLWNFGDGSTGSTSNLLHSYPDSGNYSINLKVDNIYGCTYSTSKIYLVNSSGDTIILNELNIVRIDTVKEMVFPSIFSPNNDGSNDQFRPLPLGRVSEMNMKIYNRWGQKIFETNDPISGWNGKFQNGKDCDIGTYIYSITGKNANGEALQKAINGSVILVR